MEPLGDATYQLLLTARARRLRGGADRETVEAVLAILFDVGYVDESGDPVTLQVETSNDQLYGLVSGSQFDILIPRPAGRALTMTRL